ncbi:complex I 24 kDa subunit family protein [Clostridium cadaveris]|uniref:NADH-quinone oxidoreductase subunit NuoE family protein n=1 Tax=Clostridium cadaveris TaxID=1529 RepID=UPI0006858020|nr:NAD(P)H-dependent oxidoreductase subunit E [Clostridium cadaveris]NME63417.1 NAD(P)H-dependent oxidoreductase subunit E [Clostridium cadaveris]NWK12432.1 NAD(P)H-dependent oxidoreductase subunit E [Clostridium cadaveris]
MEVYKFSTKTIVLDKNLAKEIDEIILSHDNDSTQLLGILLDIQDVVERHYIPEEIAYYLAERLSLPISQIYDVISFFSAISDKPRAKYPIEICDSVVCKINENVFLFNTLKDLLGIELNEVTYDGKFTIEKTPCFGACDVAPAVRINGTVYGKLTTREKIQDMLNSLD